MASWSTTTKHEPMEINGGNKYEIGDQVSIEQLNAITENTFNTANKDLSNVTYPQVVANGVAQIGTADRIVERWVSSDGNTWYEKYESGWQKCGGNVTTSNTSESVTIILPVTFSTTNYTLIMTKSQSSGAPAQTNDVSVFDLTVSSFKTRGYNSPVRFYACGY